MKTRIRLSQLRAVIGPVAQGVAHSFFNEHLNMELEKIKEEAHERINLLFEKAGAALVRDISRVNDEIVLETPDEESPDP